MKNTILWGTLITLMGAQTQIHADVAQPTPPTQTPNTLATPQAPATPQTQNVPSVNPAQQTPPPVINCEYKISPEIKTVDQSLVTTWSEKAVTQAFDFDPSKLEDQLQKLQACFTEQGWTGFNSALQKSGNLESIKSQKLTVSSQVMGQVTVTEAKENQWKINLPLQVVYQNDKEKVTQLLSIDVTVGRKITGELGIVQMIAAPRNTEKSDTVNAASNPDTDTAPSAAPASTPTPAPATQGQPSLPENQPAPPTPNNQ